MNRFSRLPAQRMVAEETLEPPPQVLEPLGHPERWGLRCLELLEHGRWLALGSPASSWMPWVRPAQAAPRPRVALAF
jgi:hypothetical protein